MSNSIYTVGYDSRLRELPDGYTQVEYIESSGTQYIDTGFAPNNLSACEVILSCTSVSSTANGCFGAAGANYTTDAFEFYYNGTVCNLGFGDTPLRYTSTISINDILTVRISQEERTVLLNNTQLCSDVPAGEIFTCPTTFITHALNRAGTIQYYSSTRLYSCKLWDNGILIRELIPCINPNNEIGLYDLVSKIFYDNSGTGTFIAGDIISTSPITKKIQNNYVSLLRLPENYTALEYIESTGTQCIDTGFKPNYNTSIMLDFQFTTITGTMFPFCARGGSAQSYSKPFGLLLSNTTYRSDFGTSQVSSSSIPVNTDRIMLFKIRNMCFINDSTITNTMNNFQSDYSMTLFASADGGNPNYFAKMKLYTCQLSDNGTIIRNYIPCINPNNEIGLYDLVNSTFYGNNGTGTFIAGPEVENKAITKKIKKGYTITENFALTQLPEGYTQIEYIESSGAQYIDTGLSMPNGFHAVFDATVTELTSAYQGFFGTLDSASPYYRNYFGLNNSNNWCTGCYGSRFYGNPVVNQKYSYDVCNIHNSIYLKIDGITQTASSTSEDTISATRYAGNFWIFARNYTSPTPCYIKLYNLKFYETEDYNNLIANYVPCINSNNEIGLYDLVSKTFYGNSGTGTFIAGPTYKQITKLFYEGGN